MIAERYSRQQKIIGEDSQNLLAEKKILIIGCGGLGGNLIENMLRIGIGTIIAVDPDRFEESNLNRQLLSSEPLIGTSKAEAAKVRAAAVNSSVHFIAFEEPFSKDNADKLVAGCDLVLDGLDNVPDRLLLEDICEQQNIPLVHGAILGELVQVGVVPPGSKMLHHLYANASFGKNSKSSISYTPACCAAIQCSQALKLLLGQCPPLWGKLLQMNLASMSSDILSLL